MFTVAVVGVGGMGRTHLNNLQRMPDVRIDSICDPNPAVADLAGEFHACYYTDFDEMLQKTAANIVMVFTPTFLHARQIEAVLRAGKHCISEKPLCLSSAQARMLFALADEFKVHLYVAQVLHFNREYQLLSEIIQSGRYGRVIDAVFCRLTERPKWLTGNWLFDREKSGLIPYDLHIHELDYIIGQFGKPCRARRQTSVRAAKQCEHYRFLYDYEDFTVCAEASWYNAAIPFTQGFRVYFERAVVVLEKGCMTVYEPGAQEGRVLMAAENQQNATMINVASPVPYQKEMEHFLRCIEERRGSEIVRRENVIAVLEMLEELSKAPETCLNGTGVGESAG